MKSEKGKDSRTLFNASSADQLNEKSFHEIAEFATNVSELKQ